MLRAGGDLLRVRVIAGPAATASSSAPAWEALRAELVRFVAARLGDPAAADDLVHEVLLRALAELDGGRPPRHLRGWLYRVTRNAIADHHRARRPSAELPAELPEPPAESPETAERELARCLEPLLGSLAPPYRRALHLAEVEGLTQAEIARREGLSLSGAKSRVQRARAMLRQAILACCRVELDRRGSVVEFRRRPEGAGCDRPCGRPDG